MNKDDSRQSFLGGNAQSEFDSQKIGVVGLCGGGSHIVQQLAHIGFRNFLLCDFDIVEQSNLTRMIGSIPEDAELKRQKTSVVRRLVNAINNKANIQLVDSGWQQEAIKFRDCSVIFGCVDSLAARDELERFCRRFLIPYIDIGMDVHKSELGFSISGQVALSLPEEPCLRCMGVLRDEDLANEHLHYGAAGGRPQVVWPNGSLASAAVGQYISLILPWATGMKPSLLIEYDGNRQSMSESSKLRYLAGVICPHYPITGSLGDPFFNSCSMSAP